MSESERPSNNYPGITAASENDTHGREPGQTDLGPHPATDLVGLVQNPDDPQTLTVHERGVGRPQLGTQWMQADIEDTVSLQVVR